MLVQVRNLEIELAGQRVLRDVGFGLSEGELLAVLGPNGAGKSTVVRALAGDLKSAAGVMEFAGRPLHSWSSRELARHRGVMPQRVDISFPLTAEDVICLGRPPEPRSRSRDIVRELMTLLDISHLCNRLMPRLSGGEQQRVQLARVLAQVWDSAGPVLLLLDECTSALDPAHQQQVFSLLKQLTRLRGFGVMAVVHDLNLAARFADRLLLLHQGQCHSVGTASQVLTESALQQVYGLRARILMLEEGYPLVIPTGDWQSAGYTEPGNPICRQAS